MAWIQVSTDSKTLNMQVDFQVLFPQQGAPTKNGGAIPGGPYPTLYLLHGHGGDSLEWLRNTSVERYLSGDPLAVILPNANNSWSRNFTNGFRHFDFLTEELPAKAEEWYSISGDRDGRYIGGISMGGYGALHAAFTLPERYSKVFALSPAIEAFAVASAKSADRADLIFDAPDKHSENGADLFTLASRLAKSGKPCPEVYLSCGRQDPFFEATGRFAKHLETFGFTVTFDAVDGVHDWEYGDSAVRSALKWLLAGKEA